MSIPIPTTPKTLLEKLRDGDNVSQTEFYTLYRDMVTSLGSMKGLSAAECDDLVQDVMILFFEKAPTFRFQPEKAHFRTWFGKIIHGKIIDLLRKRKLVLPIDTLAPHPAEDAAPDELFELACQAEFQKACLKEVLLHLREKVEPQTYQIFEHYVLKNHSAADTIRLFGITRNQLDKNKARCQAMLKKIVTEMKCNNPEMERDFDRI